MTKEEYYKALHDALDFSIYIGKNCFPKKDMPPISLRKIYATPLLIRALHKSYTINLLIENELIEEAEIILRVLIEISFIIAALATDEKFIDKYVESIYCQKLHYLKNLNKVSKYEESLYNAPAGIDQEIDSLRKFIKTKRIRELSIYAYAEKANLLLPYYSTYSLLCSSVHSGPTDIKDYFSYNIADKNFVIKKPLKVNSDLIIFTGIESMLRIHKSYATIYGVIVAKIAELEKIYIALADVMLRKYKMNKDIFKEV